MDDIGTYIFDFKKEADDLARSLAPTHRNILFVEVDVTAPEGKPLQADLGYAIGTRHAEMTDIQRDVITRHYIEPPQRSSECVPVGGTAVIALRTKEQLGEVLGPQDKNIMRLFTLYHETGHALIEEGPITDSYHPFRECAADAYAALQLYRRFGHGADDFLSRMSWLRATNAVLQRDTKHLSTSVLDKIVADSAIRDFSILTQEQVIARAAQYAREWTPSEDVLSVARDSFYRTRRDIDLLAETTLSAEDSFSFYIGSKFLQPFLHKKGVSFNGRKEKLRRHTRSKYTAALDQRARGMTLEDIFNKTGQGEGAPSPVVEILTVTRPIGNKPFTYKIT